MLILFFNIKGIFVIIVFINIFVLDKLFITSFISLLVHLFIYNDLFFNLLTKLSNKD